MTNINEALLSEDQFRESRLARRAYHSLIEYMLRRHFRLVTLQTYVFMASGIAIVDLDQGQTWTDMQLREYFSFDRFREMLRNIVAYDSIAGFNALRGNATESKLHQLFIGNVILNLYEVKPPTDDYKISEMRSMQLHAFHAFLDFLNQVPSCFGEVWEDIVALDVSPRIPRLPARGYAPKIINNRETLGYIAPAVNQYAKFNPLDLVPKFPWLFSQSFSMDA